MTTPYLRTPRAPEWYSLDTETRRERDRRLNMADRIFKGLIHHLQIRPIESVFDGTLLDPEE